MGRRRRSTGPAFTVEYPKPLDVDFDGELWWAALDGREVRLSNLDKVFWPDQGYTKGDLVAYYYNVAPWILPYLAERPLTMKRMPNGAYGQFFYEKTKPPNTPVWTPRCVVPSEDKTIDYLMVDHAAGVLFVANLGCIEFHPLHSRCGTIDVPDYLFFDLDPFEPATFSDVLAVARHVKIVLDQLGLRGYPKTSGATGMQIYVPIEHRYSYDAIREFVGRIGHTIRRADPARVTMEWEVKKRTGKVFIDHNMNREGANIASAFSCRPEPGATVSTPLTWEEVEAGEVRPQWFDVKTIWERLADAGDPFRPVLEEPQDLDHALDALGVEPEVVAPLPANIQGARGRRSTAVARGGERVQPAVVAARPGAKRAAETAVAAQPGEQGAASGTPPRDGVATAARKRGRTTRAPTTTSEEVIARSKDPKLGEYLRRRDLEGTPEPGPSQEAGGGSSFVIQKHRATRLHYDTRLERDGVLVSWAVPKGLPARKGDKRLAVQTEDHPLEYGTFEGLIPEGHYGAGPVRIFDHGTHEALEWTDTKVTFRLYGERYRGAEFHLIKTKTDWLVFLSKPDRVPQGESPPEYRPMLAEGGHQPFDDPGWRFEPKLDGVRTLVYLDMDSTRLVSRSGRDHTAQYPEIAAAHEYVTQMTAVLDGEIVAMADGRPSFELLQQRINLSSKSEIDRMRRTIPVELFVFDILWLDGEDLTGLPLEERRARFEPLIVPGHRIHAGFHVDGEGTALAEASQAQGFEGVVAKRLGSPYRPGRRNSDWRKIKLLDRQDCVILGWTPGTGSRNSSFGALLVGAYDDGTLRWIGQVGTGFTDRMLRDLMGRLRPLQCGEPAVKDAELRKLKGACFVEPTLVCEVEFLEMTSAGKLRAPSYKGLRTDKLPEDCVLERPVRA